MKNRLIAVAILSGVLFASAACDDSGDTTTTSPTTAAAAPATSAPASGTGSEADCDKAQAAVQAAITKLLGSAAGAAKPGSDPQAVQKGIQAAAATFTAELATASASIQDPAVKAALDDWVTLVSKKASTLKTVEDVQKLQAIDSDPEVQKASGKMAALCGG